MFNNKERFKAEYNQLAIRVNKLDNVLEKHYDKALSFTLSCNINVLERQLKAMLIYQGILEERAEIEGIELD